MNKKRPKRISVLLIPDDNAEPYSFRLNVRTVRLLTLFAIVILLHVLAGGYAYWRWYETARENQGLLQTNAELLKDNKRVYVLQEQFEDLRQLYDRMLGLLGVDRVGSLSLATRDLRAYRNGTDGSTDLTADLAQEVRPNIDRIASKSSFLSRKSSSLHDYTANLPTLLPVEGYLSADFSLSSWMLGSGQPGISKRHAGIDIAGPRGTDILASGTGYVLFAGWTSKYGNMVIINHGNDIFSFYAHNSKLLVSDKAYVRKGDPIAQLGNSGSTSKGPHLHFEIWRDGKPVNPREYILAFHAEDI